MSHRVNSAPDTSMAKQNVTGHHGRDRNRPGYNFIFLKQEGHPQKRAGRHILQNQPRKNSVIDVLLLFYHYGNDMLLY